MASGSWCHNPVLPGQLRKKVWGEMPSSDSPMILPTLIPPPLDPSMSDVHTALSRCLGKSQCSLRGIMRAFCSSTGKPEGRGEDTVPPPPFSQLCNHLYSWAFAKEGVWECLWFIM